MHKIINGCEIFSISSIHISLATVFLGIFCFFLVFTYIIFVMGISVDYFGCNFIASYQNMD